MNSQAIGGIRYSTSLRLALIACFTAANVASRLLLAPLFNIKPTTFLTAMSGVLFGAPLGFIVGLLTMLITDLLYFGAGYWSIATSFSMGFIGALSGIVWFRRQDVGRLELAVGGFLLTLLYDVITSIATLLPLVKGFEAAIIGGFIGLFIPIPYPMGPVHEATTAILMATCGPPIIKAIRHRHIGVAG
ncbi:hypothetical protein KEJ19_06945 [Candidatus Bathyarchaeota archaeon]|nr:hypothetical protein [Candidatus Bathyarchaeota archaeon]